MKYIGWLVFILICFPVGQAFHRVAGLETLGARTGPGGASATGKQKIVVMGGGVGLDIWIDPASVRENELPEKVTLKRKMEVSSADGTSVVGLEKDTVVRVLEKSGNNLTVSAMSGPLTGIVAAEQTDLLEQVVKIRAGRILGLGTGEIPLASTSNPPVPPVVPTPNPPDIVKVEPTPPIPSAPVDPPAVIPEPEPVGNVALTEEQIIKVMQDSIKASAVKEFSFDQVQAWKAAEDESVDGEDYQVGLAAYKAETIFGIKTVQAKALIKDGKLTKWVYAKTGMEIR